MAETAKKQAAKKKTTAAKRILVVVESPSKAKTIGRFLGSRYKVVASKGHIRDLPKSKLGIDIDNDFEPGYINIRGYGETIKMLKKEAKNASRILLATDPDREGEAISWHLTQIFDMDPADPCRVTFHEVSKDAVKNAIKDPRPIDMSLVNSQQARRIVDRLVGYQISPLLWKKFRKGLSAGRVQSAALKIICDREREITAFVPQEYWTIEALIHKGDGFTARLAKIDGTKAVLNNKEETDKALAEINAGTFVTGKVTASERKKNPQPPFTTSSLQQDAANKLNFNTKKTMLVAQTLYEGIDLKSTGVIAQGPSAIGLITYMRTDSVRISDIARMAAGEYIRGRFGSEYLGNNSYSNKQKDIQDAHEAIRPARPDLSPDMIKGALSSDQYKLYSLIWSRFIASQMAPAVYDSVNADINNGRYTFRAAGSKIKFEGFMKVYSMPKEDGRLLPALTEGEKLSADPAAGTQNFTQPPARFTEASLVKILEENGIGRPSTYAPIVSTLTGRGYVEHSGKSLVPTEIGFTVDDTMEEYFSEIVDSGFTSDMEDKLDRIVEVPDADWKEIIREFYGGFKEDLKIADEKITKMEVQDVPTGELCELCGKPMVIKNGPFGKFIACSGYPECKNSKNIVVKAGVKCPKCGGDIIQKRSRKGNIFYGCSNFPDCRQTYSNKPIDRKCPKCGELLMEKNTKTIKYACSNRECGYKEKQDK